jgi:transcriptional antiterminator NusG
MLGKVDELAVNADIVLYQSRRNNQGCWPFNGFNGTVEKINEEKRKLEVMVKILEERHH